MLKNSIKKLVQKKSRILVWDNEFYVPYLKYIGVIGGLLLLIFYFIAKAKGYQDATFLRFTGIAMLFLFLFLPQEHSKLKIHHKSYIELTYLLCNPVLLYYNALINPGNVYHLASMVLSGFIYGLFCHFFIGIIGMTAMASYLLLNYNASPEINNAISGIVSLSFAGFIISSIAQAIMKSSFRLLMKYKMDKRKFESLGNMAGGICHEIANPLMGVFASLELALITSREDNKMIPYIEKSLRCLDRIKYIIKNLQVFSQDNVANINDSKNLETIFQKILHNYHYDLKKLSIKINFASETKIPLTQYYCSEYILGTTIENLIKNSIDATKEISFGQRWINILVKDRKHKIEVIVSDGGTGITEEISDKIIDPFFTTKEQGSGVGLGLSVAKGLIEGVHGDFFYDPTYKNTSFIIRIPKEHLKNNTESNLLTKIAN